VKDSGCRCNPAQTVLDARLAEAGGDFMLGMILIVLLILALVGALPTWPHSRNWGYYPTSGVGLVLVILVILVLLGEI
jgi:hypothetical protein